MSVMEAEIHEQPEAVKRLIEAESEHLTRLSRRLKGRFNYILIAARGTSDNAARYAQYLFGGHNRLPVALATPSLFSVYRQPPVLRGALVVGISQSGQSPDIVAVLAEAHRQGQPTIAITNQRDSPLASVAEEIIELHAGPEMAIAATKTYTASLAAMALFSASLENHHARIAELRQLPQIMAHTLSVVEPVMDRVERFRYMDHCIVLGRGYNYATAFEIALKIKELTRVVAESYSPADFRHGPIAMVRDGFPVIVIAPSGAVFQDIYELTQEVKLLGAELLVISDKSDLVEQAKLGMRLPPDLPEWITPMAAVIPGQLFSLALAQAKGLDPDKPEGLHKVTETM